eukprot:GFYU01041416.1.p1 GENE.GFYU01041416.1~~GFYU01041416.1.p1  ORF type:complete len:247 (-),score=45.82 GFYU01041416.1:198-938(-)
MSQPNLKQVFDDLCVRFVINIPPEELQYFERLCFQIEQAHWFYDDFYREENTKLPAMSMKEFASKMFAMCEPLAPYKNHVPEMLLSFSEYKRNVPVYGCILLNPGLDKCLLVKGWTARSSWGFPKGKINKNEEQISCAAREVTEECGFDVSPYIKEEDAIELVIKQQKIRLYIIPYIPEDTHFEPQTRKEISKIEWHKIDDIPAGKPDDSTPKKGNYFMVGPFLPYVSCNVTDEVYLDRGPQCEWP